MYMTSIGGMVTSSGAPSTNNRKITGFSIDAIIGTKNDVGSGRVTSKCSNDNEASRNNVDDEVEDRLGASDLEKNRYGCYELDGDREGKCYKPISQTHVKNRFWRPSEDKRNQSPINALPLQGSNTNSLTSPRSSASPASSPASSSLSLSDSLLLHPRPPHHENSSSANAFSDNKHLPLHKPHVEPSTRTRIIAGNRTASDSAAVGSPTRFTHKHPNISFGELAQLDYQTLSSLGLFQLGLHQESTTTIGTCAPPPYAHYHYAHHLQAPHGAVPLGYHHHGHHLPHLNPTRLPFPGPELHHALVGGPGREGFHMMPWWSARHDAFLSGRFTGPEAGLLFQPFRKPKRIRTAFTPSQLLKLEQAFDKNHYVVGQERKDLAVKLGLTETQVKVWFQNRRTKHKRIKSEEGCPRSPNDSLEHDDDDDDDDTHHDEDDTGITGNTKLLETGSGIIWRPEKVMDEQFIARCCSRLGVDAGDDVDSDEEMDDHGS